MGSYSFQVVDDGSPLPAPPAADLVVSQVTAPTRSDRRSGQVQVSWTVTNTGPASTDADQLDRPRDPVGQPDAGDPEDARWRELAHPGTLVAGASDTGNTTFTLPAGFEGEFRCLSMTDPTNRVFEDQAELNNHAGSLHGTGVFAQPRVLGEALNIQLDLEDGQEFPAGSSVALSGQVTIQPAAANVLFVVDVSGSVIELTGLDANFDGVLDQADNLNGDQRVGDILDAEIGAVLRIIPSLAASSQDLRIAVVLFAGTAEPLDQGPAMLNQEWQGPLPDQNANGMPDGEEALRSALVDDHIFSIDSGASRFRSFLLVAGTHFENALLTVDQLLARAGCGCDASGLPDRWGSQSGRRGHTADT